jgi:dUTP pyrophosphatase
MRVKIKKLSPNAKIPAYQTEGAAGFDLSSCEDIVILPGQVIAVDTGLAFEIPTGYEIQVRSRSGLALKHNVFILNGIGTIDEDYRGAVKAILCNASNVNFSIRVGDRIAQGVLNQVLKAGFEEVIDLETTERGEGGFGSTNI